MDAPVAAVLENCPVCRVEAKGQTNTIAAPVGELVVWMAAIAAVDATDLAGKKCVAATVMAQAFIRAANVVDLGMNRSR